MQYEVFKKFLDEHNLSLKEFSKLSNTSYSGCNKWKYADIPPWVDSWCKLYSENHKLQNIKNIALQLFESTEK